MIFVTVGTHEQPFDRLLKCIDKMVEEGKIKEEVIIQKGYTDYEPKNCKSSKLIPYEEMQENIKSARIVVTHGGPASFLDPLKFGKIPVVVPRKKEYNEHVNNHQKEIIEKFNKNKNIIGIQSVKELEGAIKRIKNFEPKPYEENNQKLLKIIEDFIDNIKS